MPASARKASRSSRHSAKPLTVDALWAIQRIGSPTLSPDGATACAAVTRYDMGKNEGHTELWLYPTGLGERNGQATRSRRLTCGDKDSDPRWSPDGRSIAFAAKRKDDDQPQLYLIAPDGGEATRLTSLAGGAASIKWFADSRRVAFISWVWPDLATNALQLARKKKRKDDKVKAHATERSEFRFWDHWLTDGREPHLFVCDVGTGRCRDVLAGLQLALPPWEPSSDDFDISPDGREIALTVDLGAEPRMMNQTDIVTVGLASRRKRVLTDRTGTSDAHPRYSPDGRFIVFHSYDTERAFNDQGHLTLLQRSTGRMQPLAARFDRATTQVAWTPDRQALLFTAEDHGRQGLWRLRLGVRPAPPRRIVDGGHVGGFAQSRDGSVILFDRSTFSYPPALFACRDDGSDERSIETTNRALLARHSLGEVREFTVKGWGGEPVQMWAVYPPNFDPRRKWPLLHSIHGGPHAAHLDGWHFRWNAQVFAGYGYIVVGVNYHGSSSFGRRFTESITGRYGTKEYADIEAGTNHLLRQGYVDRDRLVATGGSYGGYMVAYMNGHTNRYRTYVCHAGCYDWVSMMATDGYQFFADELGAFHWNNPTRVMKQSPHHYVERAKTPTLVIHGEQDFRVPATQALQYYDTLKAKGIEARLLWFPDENHWILKPQNARLWYREFFDWVKRFAKAGPA
jgi:dipeptidyl aminopeptidase/acylaminoacyl peptidase